MKKNILELNQIDFSYGKKQVLKNVSLSIKEGTFCVLLGLNGAGKSTLFSLVTRLLNLQKGEIFINSFSIKDYSNALKISTLRLCPPFRFRTVISITSKSSSF
jgi:ABC-2 type transport system ATP-binding protein